MLKAVVERQYKLGMDCGARELRYHVVIYKGDEKGQIIGESAWFDVDEWRARGSNDRAAHEAMDALAARFNEQDWVRRARATAENTLDDIAGHAKMLRYLHGGQPAT